MNAPHPAKDAFDALRKEIFDNVENGRPFPRQRAIRLRLDKLRAPEWEAEWLETSILFNCYLRAIPARTHGNLGRLRKRRGDRDEQDLFDSFMAKVTAVLHPEFITPHGYTTTFAEMDAEAIFASMGKAFAPLAQLGCPMFLYAGALLGYVRSGKLIEHDDDIDLGIYLGECTDAQAAERWAAYKQKLADADLLSPKSTGPRVVILKVNTALDIDVDLFPAWTNEGQLSVYPYSLGQLPADTVFPLKSFGQDPLMLPLKPEALLEVSYGENWRVPDPLFHLNWPHKNRIFHELLSQDYSINTT